MPTIHTGQRCVRARTLPADLQSAAADATAADPATTDPATADPTAANPAATDAATTDAAAAETGMFAVLIEFSRKQDIRKHAR